MGMLKGARTWLMLVATLLVFLAGVMAGAQRRPTWPDERIVFPPGIVIPGAQLGFRIDGTAATGMPSGRLVVRPDGHDQWLELELVQGRR